jgi:phosphoadenosine phosphosulfate reductase
MATRAHPLEIVRSARRLTDAVLVGLSGGKDSLAVLDLCARHFERVEAYFLYTVPGLEFQERTLRYCERRYAIKVRRLPHWCLSHQLREWAFRGPVKGDVPRLKLIDVENHARELTGVNWVATGQRKDDSLERRAMLSRNGGLDLKARRFYPLADWRAASVFVYLKQRRVPLPPDYALFWRSWGGRLHANDLGKIREAFPDDYRRIVEYFPHVEAQEARARFAAGRRGEQAPDVPDEAAVPLGPEGGALQPPADRAGGAQEAPG